MIAQDLVKARLWCLDNDDWSIDLQFNPKDGIALQRNIGWTQDDDGSDYGTWGGASGFDSGKPDTLSFTTLVDESVVGEVDLADATAFQAAMLSALGSLLGNEDNTESALDWIEAFYALTVPIEPLDKGEPRPAVCAFVWEEFEFMGYITSLSVDMKLFDATGRLKRAEVQIEMEGRAFSGKVDLKTFFEGDYDPPAATDAKGNRAGQDTRRDLMEYL